MNRIKELRTEHGMNQKALAAELGVVRTTLSNYENEINQLDPQTIRRICTFFGCTADYLLCMSDQRTAEVSDFDAALIEAYNSAPDNIRNGIREMLQPYFEKKTSSALQDAQEG